jgi:cell division septal protein FtsQ
MSRASFGAIWAKMSSKKIVDLRGKQTGLQLPHTLSRSEKRESSAPVRLRARRRRTRILIAFAAFIVLCGWIYAAHWLSYRPQYELNAVNVGGVQAVPVADIQHFVDGIIHDGKNHFFSEANIFFYPRSLIEQDLIRNFPRIKTVVITRPSIMSRTLVVTVSERQSFALWCPSFSTASDQCAQMDESGYLFAPYDASTTPATSYIFAGEASSTLQIGQTFEQDHLPGILSLLHMLDQSAVRPLGLIVGSDSDFSVPTQEGYTLKLSFGEDVADVLKNLKLVLTSSPVKDKLADLEYIDLRFGNRVYYKMKGGPDPQTNKTNGPH